MVPFKCVEEVARKVISFYPSLGSVQSSTTESDSSLARIQGVYRVSATLKASLKVWHWKISVKIKAMNYIRHAASRIVVIFLKADVAKIRRCKVRIDILIIVKVGL